MNLRSPHLKKALLAVMAVVSLAILPTSAQAVPISGELNLAGRVRVDATTIDWLELLGAGTDNEFIVLFGTEHFDGLAFTQGDALDLNVALQPIGVPFSLPNFLTFEADEGLSFELQFIAPCDPASCLFPGTPFNAYQETVGGVVRTTVELAMSGIATDTAGPNAVEGASMWQGTWSQSFVGVTIADLQAAFAPGGPGFIVAPYAADIQVTFIPEPMTLLTFGAGTALLAAHRRRRTKQNKTA